MTSLSQFKEYYDVVKSKSALASYLMLANVADIEFCNGLSLRFKQGERRLLFKIVKGLALLNRMGIKTAVKDGKLSITMPDRTVIASSVDGLTKREIGNLFLLIYFAMKYGAVVGTEKLSVPKILDMPFVKFDMRRKIVETNFGIRIYLDLLSPWVFVETFILKIHDRLADSQTMAGKTFLDVGASFGDTALYFASRGYTVYALEPISVNYEALNRNISLNPALSGRIHPMRLALGKDGKLKMGYLEGIIDGWATGFHQRGMNIEEVDSLSLGSLLKRLGLNSIDYLKVDCKGGEEYLSPAELRKVRLCLKIEYELDHDGIANLLNTISKAGFHNRVVFRHNPEDTNPTSRHGTIIATRAE